MQAQVGDRLLVGHGQDRVRARGSGMIRMVYPPVRWPG
jgi:hypothetical protein